MKTLIIALALVGNAYAEQVPIVVSQEAMVTCHNVLSQLTVSVGDSNAIEKMGILSSAKKEIELAIKAAKTPEPVIDPANK